MFLSEFLCSCTSGIGESGHRTQAKMQFGGIYRKKTRDGRRATREIWGENGVKMVEMRRNFDKK
jgi:hypothetical protein